MISDHYIVKTPPPGDPVTLAEAKAFMRVDTADDDTLITALISAATSQGEKHCNRVFETRTFTGFFAGWGLSAFEIGPFVQLRRGPLVSVTSVSAVASGALELVATTEYDVKANTGFSRIIATGSLPGTDDVPYPYQVEFVAGYATVPDDIQTAIKSHVLFMYENRGDVIPDGKIRMPLETMAIYSKYRIVNTFG